MAGHRPSVIFLVCPPNSYWYSNVRDVRDPVSRLRTPKPGISGSHHVQSLRPAGGARPAISLSVIRVLSLMPRLRFRRPGKAVGRFGKGTPAPFLPTLD